MNEHFFPELFLSAQQFAPRSSLPETSPKKHDCFKLILDIHTNIHLSSSVLTSTALLFSLKYLRKGANLRGQQWQQFEVLNSDPRRGIPASPSSLGPHKNRPQCQLAS